MTVDILPRLTGPLRLELRVESLSLKWKWKWSVEWWSYWSSWNRREKTLGLGKHWIWKLASSKKSRGGFYSSFFVIDWTAFDWSWSGVTWRAIEVEVWRLEVTVE